MQWIEASSPWIFTIIGLICVLGFRMQTVQNGFVRIFGARFGMQKIHLYQKIGPLILVVGLLWSLQEILV
jgi:hypothetical protein